MIDRAVYLIGKHGFGRRRLAENLGITEMKCRLLLERLRSDNMVLFSKSGCRLTSKSLSIYKNIDKRIGGIEHLSLNGLSIDDVSVGVVLRQTMPREPWRVRDEALKAGASGAIIFSASNAGLVMPPSKKPELKYKKDLDMVSSTFSPAKGDVVVVSCAKTSGDALSGLWASISLLLAGS